MIVLMKCSKCPNTMTGWDYGAVCSKCGAQMKPTAQPKGTVSKPSIRHKRDPKGSPNAGQSSSRLYFIHIMDVKAPTALAKECPSEHSNAS